MNDKNKILGTAITFSIVVAGVSAFTIFSLNTQPFSSWASYGLCWLLILAVTTFIDALTDLCRTGISLVTEAPVVTNFNEALQSAELDEGAGVAHAALAGSVDFRVHITKLLPGAKVKAHRHDEGDELYIIQAGTATLYTGRSVEDEAEEWFEPVAVEAGATFTVSPGMLHQLHNTGDTPLVLIFGCPDSHLDTDRVVVADCHFAASSAP